MRKVLFACFFIVLLFCLSEAETIKLPIPKSHGAMSLEEAIYRRRSIRSFLPNELNKEQLSQLLWACQGITEPQWQFRAAPSAGSLYPLEIYLVNKNGVYSYKPLEHSLVRVTKGYKRPSLSRAALAQNFISEAPIDIIVTGVLSRTREKFGSRAPRYVILEAGHAAENLLLQATSLGLGAVSIGSFWDDVVATSLGLPVNHDPYYIIPIGYEKI